MRQKKKERKHYKHDESANDGRQQVLLTRKKREKRQQVTSTMKKRGGRGAVRGRRPKGKSYSTLGKKLEAEINWHREKQGGGGKTKLARRGLPVEGAELRGKKEKGCSKFAGMKEG